MYYEPYTEDQNTSTHQNVQLVMCVASFLIRLQYIISLRPVEKPLWLVDMSDLH